MKCKLFYIFSFILLLSASTIAYSKTIQKDILSNKASFYSKTDKTHFSNYFELLIALEENELENENDLQSTTNHKSKSVHFLNKCNFYNLFNKSHLSFKLVCSNSKFASTKLIIINSTPLFIQQGVFRI